MSLWGRGGLRRGREGGQADLSSAVFTDGIVDGDVAEEVTELRVVAGGFDAEFVVG